MVRTSYSPIPLACLIHRWSSQQYIHNNNICCGCRYSIYPYSLIFIDNMTYRFNNHRNMISIDSVYLHGNYFFFRKYLISISFSIMNFSYSISIQVNNDQSVKQKKMCMKFIDQFFSNTYRICFFPRKLFVVFGKFFHFPLSLDAVTHLKLAYKGKTD